MDTTTPISTRGLGARVMIIVGSIAMLFGAIDPMEGSLVILPGSGMVALGTCLGRGGRRLIAYSLGVFIRIALGVGALWGLRSAGGFGGDSGRSTWWGLLVLPALIGGFMGIWGPSFPRWLLLLGIVIGIWFLVILLMVLGGPRGARSPLPGVVIGGTGLPAIAGCLSRLRNHVSTQA